MCVSLTKPCIVQIKWMKALRRQRLSQHEACVHTVLFHSLPALSAEPLAHTMALHRQNLPACCITLLPITQMTEIMTPSEGDLSQEQSYRLPQWRIRVVMWRKGNVVLNINMAIEGEWKEEKTTSPFDSKKTTLHRSLCLAGLKHRPLGLIGPIQTHIQGRLLCSHSQLVVWVFHVVGCQLDVCNKGKL